MPKAGLAEEGGALDVRVARLVVLPPFRRFPVVPAGGWDHLAVVEGMAHVTFLSIGKLRAIGYSQPLSWRLPPALRRTMNSNPEQYLKFETNPDDTQLERFTV